MPLLRLPLWRLWRPGLEIGAAWSKAFIGLEDAFGQSSESLV